MKKIKIWLSIEVLLAIVLAAILYFVAGNSSPMYLLTLPFDALCEALRVLSLTSAFGNVIAILIYGMISLLPFFYLIWKYRKKLMQKSDILLPIISGYSFYMLYHFINPVFMLKHMPTLIADIDFLPMIKLAYSIILYSLCIVYFIFHILENATYDRKDNRTDYLNQKLQKILVIAAALYTFLVGFIYPFNMFDELNRYISQQNANASSDILNGIPGIKVQNNFDLNTIYILLKYLLTIIPILFSILILVQGIQLLKTMLSHHLQNEEILAARNLAIISKKAVYITALCNLSLNIFQFFFSKQLSNTNFTLQISLLPLIIAFSAYILAGYFKESKDLYEDNNMFI